MKKDSLKIGEMYMNGSVQPTSFSEEQRTVDVTFATEYPVSRRDWDGERFEEVLSIAPDAINMTRLMQGAPVLDGHRASGTESVLGVTSNPRIEGKQAVVTLRFSNSVRGTEAMNDVKDGILKNISVGYDIQAVEKRESGQKGVPRYVVTKWEPKEVSIVPIPADPNSQVRSQDNSVFTEIPIVNLTRSSEMTTEEKKAAEDALKATEAQRAAETDNIRKAAVLAERTRTSEIQLAVRAAKLSDEFAAKLISDGVEVDAARKAVIDEMAKVSATASVATTKVSVTADETDAQRSLQIDSILLRAGVADIKDADRVRAARSAYGTDTLLDMAKRSLTKDGVNIQGLSKHEIVTRAISSHTSDFPVLLEGANRTILLKAYQEVADTWRRFCTTGSVSDFREWKRLKMGTLSNLETVLEGGEFKTKKITDGESEKISAKTKGNIINVSRQMIINDDLNAFTRLTQMMGRAAARSIETDVYALLASNPTMGDGIALFHASHGNIAAVAAAPSVVSVDKIKQLMAAQKDKDGNDWLDIRPSIALCPVSLESQFKLVNNSTYDPEVTNKFQMTNVVAGTFSDIVASPRLTSSPAAWYAFANPSIEPVIEVAFLDGQQEPFMESRQGFEVDGMEWKVRLDYGVAAIGWRGAAKNAGV